jgi:nucleotide-binding universal stress UspA family protein
LTEQGLRADADDCDGPGGEACGVETGGRIVVGFDGSKPARRALEWAAAEARLRDAVLRVVYAWMIVPIAVPELVIAEDVDELQRSAEAYLADAVAGLLPADDGVEVELVVVNARPAEALLEAAKDADLLVVGSRGLGGFAGLLLGSISSQCAHHAPCPVVIVRAAPS